MANILDGKYFRAEKNLKACILHVPGGMELPNIQKCFGPYQDVDKLLNLLPCIKLV